METGASVSRALRFGYFQQVVALGSLLGFNLLVPAVTGLVTFGRFTVVQGYVMLVAGVCGGGLDLLLARDIRDAKGRVRRNLFWRSLGLRMLLSAGLSLLLLIPPSPLPEILNRNAVPAWVVLALVLAGAASSHCIYVIIGLGRTRTATLLSALHAVPYFGLPLLLWWMERNGANSLLRGVLASYAIIVVVETAALFRLPWTDEWDGARWLALIREAAPLSANALFDTVRTWGTVLVASRWLGPAELGIGRATFSIATALVSVIPVPVHALVSLRGRLREDPLTTSRLMVVLRHATVMAAFAASVVVLLYAAVTQPGSIGSFLRCAPAAILLTASGPGSRLALAYAVASPDGVSVRLLGYAVAGVVVTGFLSAWIGAPGVLIGGAVASALLVSWLPRPTLREVMPVSSVLVVSSGAGALWLAAGLTGSWVLGLALSVFLLGVSALTSVAAARKKYRRG
jgi:O-antigen/teichoic acid export membrane protein